MLTAQEARRIADAIGVLRPDWDANGIYKILGDERLRLRRSARDVTIALVALATDPATRKPTRIFEHGPWWECARPLAPVISLYRQPTGRDCATCSLPENDCRARYPGNGHDFDPRPPEPAPPPADLIPNQTPEGVAP